MDYNQSHPLYFPFEHSLHELDILVLWLNIQMHNNPWLGLIHLITKIPIELKLPFYLEKQSSQLLHELCLTKVARSSKISWNILSFPLADFFKFRACFACLQMSLQPEHKDILNNYGKA